MNAVMAMFGQDEDVEPRDAAEVWIADNREKAETWMEGIKPVENESIELAYIEWDTELSSTNVVTLLLEELGYDVTLTLLDMGIAFQGALMRSEEHTSELQSRGHLVCRLLLEKKK